MVASVEAGPTPIRVLLVEDNDVFRQALILLLELRPASRSSGQWPRGTAPSLPAASMTRMSA